MTQQQKEISFDNTEYAFAYKNDAELRKARFLFSSMGIDWLVNIGTRLTPLAMRLRLPVNGIIRNTIFQQFVGGETLEETAKVADRLETFGVKVILDYGVEGKEGEANFDHARDEFIRVIGYASTQANIPFISIKVTGFARFSLLEKLNELNSRQQTLEGVNNVSGMSPAEQEEWQRVEERMDAIIREAAQKNIGVLVDAEESWIQEPVDALTMEMMEKYNRSKAVVFNTIQLYRHDRLQFLKDSFSQADKKGFVLGAKLVRGAYMEKERVRAAERDYPSPIQPNKAAADRDYNLAIECCIEHLDKISVIVASHNEYSNLYTTQLMRDRNIPLNHVHVHFSQLYGMSDNITFNLAKAGCSVSKYLPFGPIQDVIPYLMRRAQENSSVSGHTGRELGLIKKELRRRTMIQ
jgi:proline dehydrogenase